jgi:plastocyanin
MSKQPALLLSALALAVGVAACGSSSSSSTAAGGSTGTSSAASTGTGTSSAAGTSTGSSSAATSSSSAAGASAGGSSSLTLAANPGGQLAYDKKSLSAKAGKVTIAFTNMAPEPHNVTIQKGTGATGAVVGSTPTFQGGSKSLTVSLKPGTYTFFCSVPGHRAGGMVGTLTVS